MITRTLTLVSASCLIGALLACSPDRSPKIPNDTPDCAATCDAAWACGGVLENDLQACIASCDEEDDGDYRLCVNETVCEEMHTCKVYAPGDGGPGGDTGAQ